MSRFTLSALYNKRRYLGRKAREQRKKEVIK
jgi:hypothetical protein